MKNLFNTEAMRRQSLDTLRIECLFNGVIISDIKGMWNGYQVTFEDLPGDAILHDYSYGREDYAWETMGFPWDYDDVSIHDPATLARMLGALRRGEDWTRFDGD